MPRQTIRLTIGLAACGLLLMSGCALDPMERLSEQIDSQKVSERQSAVVELANLDDDRAIEALVEVLESDEKVFDMAGVALVKQGRATIDLEKKPDPVITMVAGVMNNVHLPTPNRSRAAWVLGEIGDREAIPTLRSGAAALLASGAVAAPVRAQAVIALEKLGEKSVGTPFDLAMGSLEGPLTMEQTKVEPVAEPEEEDEDEEEEATAEAAPEEEDVEAAGADEETADQEASAVDEQPAEDEGEPADDVAAPDEGADDTGEEAGTEEESATEGDDKPPSDDTQALAPTRHIRA